MVRLETMRDRGHRLLPLWQPDRRHCVCVSGRERKRVFVREGENRICVCVDERESHVDVKITFIRFQKDIEQSVKFFATA